jgi:hypothetical protein
MKRSAWNYWPVPAVLLGAIPSFGASSTPWTADRLSSEGLTTFIQSKFFRDVTTAIATAHIHRGHGVAYADLYDEGAKTFISRWGGAYTGDRARNQAGRRQGQPPRHWGPHQDHRATIRQSL